MAKDLFRIEGLEFRVQVYVGNLNKSNFLPSFSTQSSVALIASIKSSGSHYCLLADRLQIWQCCNYISHVAALFQYHDKACLENATTSWARLSKIKLCPARCPRPPVATRGSFVDSVSHYSLFPFCPFRLPSSILFLVPSLSLGPSLPLAQHAFVKALVLGKNRSGT